ncbi:MAG TPA: hypothetical protein VGS07_27680 [Thermoanaerobaculia bacterium]|jgi:hypothetical protein|nr:hypothetical protein [Thermoanaerobaculia bacterium]
MKALFTLLVALLVAMPLLAAQPSSTPPQSLYGVLVMAHGGGPAWNQAVAAAVEPVRKQYPVEIAFGMADACSLQEAVGKLEAQGVRKIGVVRLFVSGESFYPETLKILGLQEGAPVKSASACGTGEAEMHHGPGTEMSMAFFRIDSRSAFAVSRQGLAEAPEMGSILADRAKALSQQPAQEDVLILAHGPGDDQENEQWLANIDRRASEIGKIAPFHRVEVRTLREDWPDKRKAAEQGIRDFVSHAASEGRKTIVIPFRVEGFGPYKDVLTGLPYVSDGRGLLPHESFTRWIERQAGELRVEALQASRGKK